MPSRRVAVICGCSAFALFACLDAIHPGTRIDADAGDTLTDGADAGDTLTEASGADDARADDTMVSEGDVDRDTAEVVAPDPSAFAVEVGFGATWFDTACVDVRARVGAETLWSVGDPRFARDTAGFYASDPDADRDPGAAAAHGAVCAAPGEAGRPPVVSFTGACRGGLEHEVTV